MINLMRKKITNKKGFTLVEVIVAVGIFSIVMTIALGAIISIVGANKKAQALHNVINNLNLAVESMVRDMRMGYDYECDYAGYYCYEGSRSFSFKSKQYNTLNDEPITVTYRYQDEEDELFIEKSVDGGEFVRITGEEVKIEKLNFFSSSDLTTSYSRQQPVILVVIEGKAVIGQEESKFNIQTLVSQRLLDI